MDGDVEAEFSSPEGMIESDTESDYGLRITAELSESEDRDSNRTFFCRNDWKSLTTSSKRTICSHSLASTSDLSTFRQTIANRIVKSPMIKLRSFEVTRSTANCECDLLFQLFMLDQIRERGLNAPFSFDVQIVPSILPSNSDSLRLLTKRFGATQKREIIQHKAMRVNLVDITFNNYQEILLQLFHETNVAWERVLLLFFFSTDILIRAIEERLVNSFFIIYEWTTRYINRHLCGWVEEQGGWDVVLQGSNIQTQQVILTGVCLLGIMGLCVFLRIHNT